MNESIIFLKDSPYGKYKKDDLGTMIAVTPDYSGVPCAVVKLENLTYVLAPLDHIAAGTVDEGLQEVVPGNENGGGGEVPGGQEEPAGDEGE